MGTLLTGIGWRVERGWRRIAAASSLSARALLPVGRLRMRRVLIAPPDIRTADPTLAFDFYAGRFVFQGQLAHADGGSVFEVEPPSALWEAERDGFGWLRHLRAADTDLARAQARALLDDFMRLRERARGNLREPEVAARRLISCLSHAPLLLAGADHDFHQRYLGLLRRDAERLRRAAQRSDRAWARLQALIGLAFAGVTVEGAERLEPRLSQALADELARQVLPDGVHISRDAGRVVTLLLDLLPLRSAYSARSLDPPGELLAAIDRMTPHLRMMRHGDGTLGLFQGMGPTAIDALATLFASHDPRGPGLPTEAPYGGFQRLDAGDSLLLMDVGASAPFEASERAHAGIGAFEFSRGFHRIVVNCGVWPLVSPALRTLLRTTPAHSTVCVGEGGYGQFVTQKGQVRLLPAPASIEVRRGRDQQAETLQLSYQDRVRKPGLVVAREVTLARDGLGLAGVDSVSSIGRGGLPVEARFHLHPDVSVLGPSEAGVVLATPDGARWQFAVSQGLCQVEESVFLGSHGGARRTSQIVLRPDRSASAGDGTVRLAWSLVLSANTAAS